MQVKKITAGTLRDGVPVELPGVDLDSIVAGIIWDLRAHWRVSQETLGELLDTIGQQKVSDIEKAKGSTTLSYISRICAALEETPVDFFLRHDSYASGAKLSDRPFIQLKSVISPDSAERLLRVLEVLNGRGDGSVERYITHGEGFAGISRDDAKPRRSGSGGPRAPKK